MVFFWLYVEEIYLQASIIKIVFYYMQYLLLDKILGSFITPSHLSLEYIRNILVFILFTVIFEPKFLYIFLKKIYDFF